MGEVSGKAHSNCLINVPANIVHKDLGGERRWEYNWLNDSPKMSVSLEPGNILGNKIRENEGSDRTWAANQLTLLQRDCPGL